MRLGNTVGGRDCLRVRRCDHLTYNKAPTQGGGDEVKAAGAQLRRPHGFVDSHYLQQSRP